MKIEEFITHYCLNAPQIMWFLGAGSSRSAGMPSASDIVWDLKRKYYCAKENRDISDNELSNEAVKSKIQSYLASSGLLVEWPADDYSYYFKLVLGDNPETHQRFLEGQLNPAKVSINSGHRVLAALMQMRFAKLVFTTNFDSVVETAYAFMANEDLRAFELNGSYAALNALNNEAFPIYAKMHGDFRYFEVKNLPEQLASNDAEIEKCFIQASSRYGLVVTGYSGRDKNVMAAFDKAIQNPNAFPKGLFWITSIQGHTFPAVEELIYKAKEKDINAHIVEGVTFDSVLSSIWKALPNKPVSFEQKIRRAIFERPRISKYTGNTQYPIIRLNGFEITQMPSTARSIETKTPLSHFDLVNRIGANPTSAIISRERSIVAWGSDDEISKIIPSDEIVSSSQIDLGEYFVNFRESSTMKAFFHRALARALVKDKPVILRKKRGQYYAVVSVKHPEFARIEHGLKSAIKSYDVKTGRFEDAKALAGRVGHLENTFWMECVGISLEFIDGKFWLVLTPDIWIEPDLNRKDARDFLTSLKRSRYNSVQNALLDEWKKILLANMGTVRLSTFNEEITNNAHFSVNTQSAHSFRDKS